jgi:hypothetical protein
MPTNLELVGPLGGVLVQLLEWDCVRHFLYQTLESVGVGIWATMLHPAAAQTKRTLPWQSPLTAVKPRHKLYSTDR